MRSESTNALGHPRLTKPTLGVLRIMAFNLRADLGAEKGGRILLDRQVCVKPGRNESCPCGSGKKYKKCCGDGQLASSGVETVVPGAKMADARAETAVPEARTAAREAATVVDGDVDEFVAMIRAGRFEDLEATARGLIQREPNSGLAWKALSVSLTMQGKDALHAMTQAATLLPADPEAHSNLGNALHGLRRLDEAVASFRRALEMKADFAEACNNLGNALRGLGRLDEAVVSYRRALEIKPCYPEACNNLGNALLD